jgi:Holliday junction resolvase RusA-like endonuclease
LRIILPGIPCSQARMRYFSRGKFGQVYDPSGKDKIRIRHEIKQQFEDKALFEHPHVSFLFYMPIPKSLSKKAYEEMSSGLIRQEKKPDVDNMAKLYLDCLDGICFEGDQKVSLGSCIKLYHPSPSTHIIITELPDISQLLA